MSSLKNTIKNKLSFRTDFPIVDKLTKYKKNSEECQGCHHSYKDADVMIVDGVGPVCFNCLHDTARVFLD